MAPKKKSAKAKVAPTKKDDTATKQAAEKKVESKQPEEKADVKKADVQKAEVKKAAEDKSEEKKIEVKKAEEEKANVKKAEEKKAEEKKAEEKKAEEKKAVEKKAEEKKAEEKKADEKVMDPVEEAEPKKAENAEAKDVVDGADQAARTGEQEEDAPADSRKKLDAGAVQFNMADATLNAMPSSSGKMLMCLNEGGLQYLLASVRASVGVKAGRYMFEVKVVENLNPSEPGGGHARGPAPKQLVRVGFSLAGSSRFLADTEDSVCFDSEGHFTQSKKRSKAAQKFGTGQTAAVLLNLDAKSPNANTVSLFLDGVRCSQPQPLPETLRGKTLFPTITYRNVSLRVNFGPTPLVALPFSCRMLQDAAADDTEAATIPATKGDKYEVVFPVGLPDQGVFDWVDKFVEENPSYTELSSRAIVEWAAKSGIRESKGQKSGTKRGSNDQPVVNFGLPLLDDLSVRKVLATVSPMLKRNFVVAELRSNLVAEERAAALARFAPTQFQKVAAVVVGEPNEEYKARVQKILLADKEASVAEAKKKKEAEAERKRLMEAKRKKAEEAKKLRDGTARKRKVAEEGEVQQGDDELGLEADGEKGIAEGAGEAAKEADEDKVQLTEEEIALWHRKLPNPDLTEEALAKSFAKFSLPLDSEGFDDIRYEWQPQAKAEAIMRDFVLEQKKTQKVHDLPIPAWFTETWATWQEEVKTWKMKQRQWKDPVKRKELEKKIGDEDEEFNMEELDVFAVEDIDDVGTGEPLYANYEYEDWALLNIRFELHLLVHAFKQALDDPDRPSFMEKDLDFYYNMHFKKHFSAKAYAVGRFAELAEMVKDSIGLDSDGYLTAPLESSTPNAQFIKITEEHRRERERRVDAGDEGARLKFPPPQQQLQQQGSAPPRQHGSAPPAAAPATGKRPIPSASAAVAGLVKRLRTPAGASGAYGGGFAAGGKSGPVLRGRP